MSLWPGMIANNTTSVQTVGLYCASLNSSTGWNDKNMQKKNLILFNMNLWDFPITHLTETTPMNSNELTWWNGVHLNTIYGSFLEGWFYCLYSPPLHLDTDLSDARQRIPQGIITGSLKFIHIRFIKIRRKHYDPIIQKIMNHLPFKGNYCLNNAVISWFCCKIYSRESE